MHNQPCAQTPARLQTNQSTVTVDKYQMTARARVPHIETIPTTVSVIGHGRLRLTKLRLARRNGKSHSTTATSRSVALCTTGTCWWRNKHLQNRSKMNPVKSVSYCRIFHDEMGTTKYGRSRRRWHCERWFQIVKPCIWLHLIVSCSSFASLQPINSATQTLSKPWWKGRS